jgi:hypothetical protein
MGGYLFKRSEGFPGIGQACKSGLRDAVLKGNLRRIWSFAGFSRLFGLDVDSPGFDLIRFWQCNGQDTVFKYCFGLVAFDIGRQND